MLNIANRSPNLLRQCTSEQQMLKTNNRREDYCSYGLLVGFPELSGQSQLETEYWVDDSFLL